MTIITKDAADYSEVIQAAEREENYDELVPYLLMARNKAHVDMCIYIYIHTYTHILPNKSHSKKAKDQIPLRAKLQIT